MDPNNPYIQFTFFSAAMALYNTMMVVMRGSPEDLVNFTKHVRDDLNLYFMPKDSSVEH